MEDQTPNHREEPSKEDEAQVPSEKPEADSVEDPTAESDTDTAAKEDASPQDTSAKPESEEPDRPEPPQSDAADPLPDTAKPTARDEAGSDADTPETPEDKPEDKEESRAGEWDDEDTAPAVEPAPRAIVALGEPGIDYLGTGRRKTATARIRLRRGSGDFTVNGKKMQDYFPLAEHQSQALLPFQVTETMGFFNAKVRVRGGGASGQAGAVRLGVARALCEVDAELRPLLKKEGLLRRDPRMVERKKYGKKGARKSFQFSKR